MKIDYCIKCGKAGLKYERIPTLAWKPDTRTSEEKEEYLINHALGKKWCPRCCEWVVPENHPYIKTGDLCKL
ncbi:MAG: hypothetical protein WC373_11060 [Smithella sp.]|jgi:hypothetical protein